MKTYETVIHEHPELQGSSRYCNICGYRFSRFLPFGVKPREAKCPVCGSLERHRHIYIHIASLYPFLNSKRVLHFAPEPILKEIFLKSGAEYFDVDIRGCPACFLILKGVVISSHETNRFS